MNWPLDVHRQYAFDRQQSLLDEAAAARLVGGGRPARTRILRRLKSLSVGRAAAQPCPPVGAPLTERR